MTFGGNRDIGALASTERLHLAAWTQATHSGNEQNGGSIDTQPQLSDTSKQALRSGEIVVEYNATLTASQTLGFSVTLQDAADNGAGSPDTWADVAAGVLLGTAHNGTGDLIDKALATVLAAAPSGKQNLGPIDLTRLRRHVRLQVTPTFSNAGDSAVVAIYMITGGSVIRPVDASAA